MTNPNSNPIIHDVLEEQNQKIEEYKMKCIETYGENVITNSIQSSNSSYCPASWDGITCWPSVPAGTLAAKNCSSLFYIKGFVLENKVTKHCLENGSWLKKNGLYWTNFTQCHEQNDTTIFVTPHTLTKNDSILLEENLSLVKAIKETGYSISLLTLIIAIFIMVTIRKLHCSRNILHIHLFASFILRASIFLIKDVTLVDGVGLRSDFLGYENGTFFKVDPNTNNWQCKLLTSSWHYFTMANYSWILMEGLYLYNLIFRALFADSGGSILGYIIMGWGFPFIVVTAWVLGRIFLEDTLCWTTNISSVYLVIDIPMLLSVIVNLIFFVRISMVLLNKLRSPLNEDNRRCYMKWAKSTLVLVPLFGVNYVLFLGLKFIRNEVVELVWIICDSIFGSFQGFFVAVLYCFMNGEVKTELKPFFHGILPYLATHKVFSLCFPCKEQFLRSTKGRISVCTTLSCSSVCANGLMRTNLKNKEIHNCQNWNRASQDVLTTTDSARTSVNLSRKQSIIRLDNNESVEMSLFHYSDLKPSQEEYMSMLPK